MFLPLNRLRIAVLVWSAAAALLFWSRLPGPWRRLLAVLASTAGVVFLLLAMKTEGLREVPTLSAFLLGTPYVAHQASASASLPYYVLAGLGLLLGTAGLATSDNVVRAMRRRWLATAAGVGLLVTALRFCLEKVAAPALWSWGVGVSLLDPLVGAFFAVNLREESRPFGALPGSLLRYAVAVRGGIAALSVVATTLRLGSHYDVSSVRGVEMFGRVFEFTSGSWTQLFVVGVAPQVVFWPVYTVVMGLLGGGIAWLLASGASGRGLSPLDPPDLGVATASEDR